MHKNTTTALGSIPAKVKEHFDPVYDMTRWLIRIIARPLFDLTVVGEENIPSNMPCILVANHSSYLDGPLVASVCERRLRCLMTKSLFRGPFLRWYFHRLGLIPVCSTRRGRPQSLNDAYRVLSSGNALLIFPEGERSWNGKLGEPMLGLGFLVYKTKVPIVPIWIEGAHQAWPRAGRLRSSKITITIGPRVAPEKVLREDYVETSRACMEYVKELQPH